MKAFLIKLLWFSLLLACYCLANFGINKLIIKKSGMDIKKVSVLIAGDSHPARSIDPAFFPSAQNIAKLAEPYPLTYWKLEKILSQPELDQAIDTIIIGFTHHNVSRFNDYKFVNEQWSSEMFARTYTIHDITNNKDIPLDRRSYYTSYIKKMLLYPNLKHQKIGGNYYNEDMSKIDDYDEVIDRHFYMDGKPAGISTVAINYLDSIINLCQQHDKKLILVASSVHPKYYTRIPDYIVQAYNQRKQQYRQQGLEVIDMTDNFYADSSYLNSDHLNRQGAEEFTSSLKSNLRKS